MIRDFLGNLLEKFKDNPVFKIFYRLPFAQKLYHKSLSFLGALLYFFPSKKLFVIGVTGTKGKSTTIELINSILEAAGKRTALLSSIRVKIDRESEPNVFGNSMPGRFLLQRFLYQARRRGCEYAIVEVTSQGTILGRHRFIDWDAGVFTNLSPEHIEAHGSFEKYRAAKVEFFNNFRFSGKKQKYFFINENDPNRHYFEKAARSVAGSKVVFFSRDRFVKQEVGSRYNLSSAAGRRLLNDWLLADFNLENAAAAAAFAGTMKIPWQIIKKAFDNFRGVPGRLEFVQKSPFAVVIDYAHTPDSLRKVYETVRPESLSPRSAGNLICVLGAAGGGRDKWKRGEMGKIAATFCDKIILTNEDPYDENPAEILRQIEDGFLKAPAPRLKPQDHYHILDRRDAIRKAVSMARRGDVVIITGKGSELWLHLSHGKKLPWNERAVVEEALKTLKS